MSELSVDELNLLSTALANLCNTRALCKVMPDQFSPEKSRFRFLCSDGKKRVFSRRELIGLIERLAGLAGQDLDVRGVLAEAGFR